MALKEIEFGSAASSATLNDNFNYLDERINNYNQSLENTNATLVALVNSKISTVSENISEEITNLINTVNDIGQPIFRLDNTIYDNEIRLEGAEVSISDYPSLYSIYGNTYGTASAGKFKLPNCKGRAFWGDSTFGYIGAGLPNIKAKFSGAIRGSNGLSPTGACTYLGSPGNIGHDSVQGYYAHYEFDASSVSSIYKDDCDTVQPPAIKIRVVTRFE